MLAGGFAWMLTHGGLPLIPPSDAFVGLVPWAIFANVLMCTLVMVLRSLRWNILLRPLQKLDEGRVLGIGLVGTAAILIAPLRMGELLRPYLLVERSDISYEQSLGTVAAERIIDGMILTALLLAGLQTSPRLSPLPDHIGAFPIPAATIPAAAYTALFIFTGAFTAMILFYWRREFMQSLIEATLGRLSPSMGKLVATRVGRLADGLKFLPSRSGLARFLGLTLVCWLLNAAMIWVLLRGCGLDASFSHAIVVMGVTGIGILVPAGPGFFGAYQLSTYCALVLYFPVSEVVSAGSAFVFFGYVIQLSLTFITGLVGFRMMGPPTHAALEVTTPAPSAS